MSSRRSGRSSSISTPVTRNRCCRRATWSPPLDHPGDQRGRDREDEDNRPHEMARARPAGAVNTLVVVHGVPPHRNR
ncbi:MAG: hypothetical protein M3203_12075 [Actinomycetota bacterium]|nr:hypothetical protein [Actinomycetota bacterium]